MKRLMLLLTMLVLPFKARAAVLTMDFSGITTDNSPFNGSVSFDLNTPMVNDPDAAPGTYMSPVVDFVLFTGQRQLSFPGGGSFMTTISDGQTSDNISMANGLALEGGYVGDLAFWFSGGDGTVFNDNSIANIKNAGQLENNGISYDNGFTGSSFNWHFTSFDERAQLAQLGQKITEEPVPEPKTWVLLIGGFFMAFISSKWRKNDRV